MADPEALAVKVTATVVAELVKGGGKALIDWLKRRCSRKTAEAANALVADPGGTGTKQDLAESLHVDLLDSATLADELRGFLSQSSGVYASQTAISGDGGTIIQIQGNDNRTGRTV